MGEGFKWSAIVSFATNVASSAYFVKTHSMEYIVTRNPINHDYTLSQTIKTATGTTIGYHSIDGLHLMNGEHVDRFIKDSNGNIAYYISNNILKSVDDGKSIGDIVTKNNIDFVFINGNRRPDFAINSDDILISNKTLQNSGLNHSSIATIYSDSNLSNSNYYRALYSFEHPEVKMDEVVVHHSLEQQILNRYPGVFTQEEVLKDPLTFRGIPKELNIDLHNRQIRKIWDEAYDKINSTLRQNANWSDIEKKSFIQRVVYDTRDYIDSQFGYLFLENK